MYAISYILFICLQLMVCILLMAFVSNSEAVKQEMEELCIEVCDELFFDCVRYDHCDEPKLRRRKWPLGVSKDCTAMRSRCLGDCLAACKSLRDKNLVI